MKIILLCGLPNSGKTTTINIVYDTLMNNGATVINKKSKLGSNINDFECIIEFNKKKTAIYSMGDYKTYCIEAIIKYSDCDVLILAYSDRFKENLCKTILQNSQHSVITKTKNDLLDSANIISKI